jgi:hypothetical protein
MNFQLKPDHADALYMAAELTYQGLHLSQTAIPYINQLLQVTKTTPYTQHVISAKVDQNNAVRRFIKSDRGDKTSHLPTKSEMSPRSLLTVAISSSAGMPKDYNVSII